MAGETYLRANTGTLTVESPEPEPAVSEDQLAGRGARWLAVILDRLILILLPLAAGFLGSVLFGSESAVGPVLAVVVALAYFAVQCYLLSVDGQTFGKKLMNVRIVHKDTGRNGGFVQNVLVRVLVNGLLDLVPLYSLIDTLLIFRDDRRCIHDMLANTVVIKA